MYNEMRSRISTWLYSKTSFSFSRDQFSAIETYCEGREGRNKGRDIFAAARLGKYGVFSKLSSPGVLHNHPGLSNEDPGGNKPRTRRGDYPSTSYTEASCSITHIIMSLSVRSQPSDLPRGLLSAVRGIHQPRKFRKRPTYLAKVLIESTMTGFLI